MEYLTAEERLVAKMSSDDDLDDSDDSSEELDYDPQPPIYRRSPRSEASSSRSIFGRKGADSSASIPDPELYIEQFNNQSELGSAISSQSFHDSGTVRITPAAVCWALMEWLGPQVQGRQLEDGVEMSHPNSKIRNIEAALTIIEELNGSSDPENPDYVDTAQETEQRCGLHECSRTGCKASNHVRFWNTHFGQARETTVVFNTQAVQKLKLDRRDQYRTNVRKSLALHNVHLQNECDGQRERAVVLRQVLAMQEAEKERIEKIRLLRIEEEVAARERVQNQQHAIMLMERERRERMELYEDRYEVLKQQRSFEEEKRLVVRMENEERARRVMVQRRAQDQAEESTMEDRRNNQAMVRMMQEVEKLRRQTEVNTRQLSREYEYSVTYTMPMLGLDLETDYYGHVSVKEDRQVKLWELMEPHRRDGGAYYRHRETREETRERPHSRYPDSVTKGDILIGINDQSVDGWSFVLTLERLKKAKPSSLASRKPLTLHFRKAQHQGRTTRHYHTVVPWRKATSKAQAPVNTVVTVGTPGGHDAVVRSPLSLTLYDILHGSFEVFNFLRVPPSAEKMAAILDELDCLVPSTSASASLGSTHHTSHSNAPAPATFPLALRSVEQSQFYTAAQRRRCFTEPEFVREWRRFSAECNLELSSSEHARMLRCFRAEISAREVSTSNDGPAFYAVLTSWPSSSGVLHDHNQVHGKQSVVKGMVVTHVSVGSGSNGGHTRGLSAAQVQELLNSRARPMQIVFAHTGSASGSSASSWWSSPSKILKSAVTSPLASPEQSVLNAPSNWTTRTGYNQGPNTTTQLNRSSAEVIGAQLQTAQVENEIEAAGHHNRIGSTVNSSAIGKGWSPDEMQVFLAMQESEEQQLFLQMTPAARAKYTTEHGGSMSVDWQQRQQQWRENAAQMSASMDPTSNSVFTQLSEEQRLVLHELSHQGRANELDGEVFRLLDMVPATAVQRRVDSISMSRGAHLNMGEAEARRYLRLPSRLRTVYLALPAAEQRRMLTLEYMEMEQELVILTDAGRPASPGQTEHKGGGVDRNGPRRVAKFDAVGGSSSHQDPVREPTVATTPMYARGPTVTTTEMQRSVSVHGYDQLVRGYDQSVRGYDHGYDQHAYEVGDGRSRLFEERRSVPFFEDTLPIATAQQQQTPYTAQQQQTQYAAAAYRVSPRENYQTASSSQRPHVERQKAYVPDGWDAAPTEPTHGTYDSYSNFYPQANRYEAGGYARTDGAGGHDLADYRDLLLMACADGKLVGAEEERLAKYRAKYGVPMWQHYELLDEITASSSSSGLGSFLGQGQAGNSAMSQRPASNTTLKSRRGSSPKKIQHGSFSRITQFLHGEA
jgi:hypothetical protein